MVKKKRQFINKKTAHNFTLVHRSQRDPLQADEDSAQHVLVPTVDSTEAGTAASNVSSREDPTKYGIDFVDDYDYMQHLRVRGEGTLVLADENIQHNYSNCDQDAGIKNNDKIPFGKLLLPSEALPSKYEERIGMLNKGVLPRGPQPDWDPDIVAALDDGIDLDDPDNFLDDDFISIANGRSNGIMDVDSETCKGTEEEWETASGSSNDSYIDSDNLLSDDEDYFESEETKSRFTNYSMTSSIIRRTQGLKLLDDQFERIMEEYDEEEIGCIDHEEVTGNFDVNTELVTQVVDEFIDQQSLHGLSEMKNSENDDDDDRDFIQESDNESEEETDEKLFAQFEKKPKEEWDCESIISTYSNIYNHPKLITEENRPKKYQLNKHTGIPVGVLNEQMKHVTVNDDDSHEKVIVNNIRNRKETPEEKRARKQSVKDQRKDRRVEKKNNKLAFRDEYHKQEKIVQNQNSQKGIKM